VEDIQFGGYKPTKNPKFRRNFTFPLHKIANFNITHQEATLVFIYSAPQLQECLINLLTYLHCLRAYIAVCPPGTLQPI